MRRRGRIPGNLEEYFYEPHGYGPAETGKTGDLPGISENNPEQAADSKSSMKHPEKYFIGMRVYILKEEEETDKILFLPFFVEKWRKRL